MSYLPVSSESRRLVKSDLVVSPISWGMWRFTDTVETAPRARVEAALGAGVTLFDTADIYGAGPSGGFGGAEALLGEVFAEAPHLRDKMVLASKGGIRVGVPYDSSASYLTTAIDDSLRRLRTDVIDLWQIHRPDILTHPAEISRALETAHAAGKVRAIGVSNHTTGQVAALQANLTLPVISHQIEFSPLALEPIADGTLDQAMASDMAIMAWSPLGGGRIGNPRDARTSAVALLLDAIAQAYGVSRAAAAYSWILAHPARPIVIVGTQTPARIAEIPDSYKPRWTRQQWYEVLQASMEMRLP